MKNILSTWALLLVLPWKLTGETTLKPNSTRQHEDAQKHETTMGRHETTMFSTENTDLSLKPNGEPIHSPGSTRQHKTTDKHLETTARREETTTFSTKTNNLSLKSSSETSHSPSSTRLHTGPSKDQTTTRIHEPITFFMKNQEKYTTEKGKNVSSTKPPAQTSERQQVTNISHAISTGESTPSSHLSLLSFMTVMTHKKTDLMTITPLPQTMPKEVITTRDDQNFTITSEVLHRSTQENKTQTDISSHFQNTSIFNQSVQITETTKWSSLPQEKGSAHLPKPNITDSNGTSDITDREKKDTSTYPLSTLTNTDFFTGYNPTVSTVVHGTTGATEAMNKNATYETTTKDITEGKLSNPYRVTTPTTQTKNTKTTNSIMDNNKRHPGPIVASLIGSILFFMFIAFVVVLVRSHRLKKRQMENPDWAGPSPFIESDIQPNLPTVRVDGPFNHQEPKRISLYSFLPQQLTKRFSTMGPPDEVVPLENTQESSTFGHHDVQPPNGKATPDQIQTHDTNSSPTELSSDSNVPETVSVPAALENNGNFQTVKLNEEGIQSPPEETNSATPTPPFEDVDLNHSVVNHAESTKVADAIHIPFPSPPVTPS